MDESKVVIYFNRGVKCCLRMIVSIYSLRKHYDGNVIVLCQGKQPDWFIYLLNDCFNCEIRDIPDSGEKNPLAIKPQLHRYVNDFDLIMFLDADTLILDSIDEYFDLIRKYGFVTGNFSNWKTTGSQMSRRIKQWEKAVPELVEPALAYGTAVNTGINGWCTGTSALYKWEEVCRLGRIKECTDRIVDEVACQLILPQVPHFLAGPEWGASVKFYDGDWDKIKIIHYHGKKHAGGYPLCDFWKQHYLEFEENLPFDDISACYDRSLIKWVQQYREAKDVTLVTAVSADYLKKFKKNFYKWIRMNPFRDMEILIFVAEDCCHYFEGDNFKDSIKGITDRVRIIKWNHGGMQNIKELMLSAFTFGVAEHVKTKYWVKIDCDVTPKGSSFKFPKGTFKNTLTATKWGYTKVKHDPKYLEDHKHWLHRLDEWADNLDDFDGTEPLFSDVNIEETKHKHRRICTFFAVEKTAFTQHLADMCKRSKIRQGLLPVPSHDTTVWYVITRLGNGRSILEYNFKQDFQP